MNKFFGIAALALAIATTAEAGGATEITSRENFDEVTKGKNAFVKFLAPWQVIRQLFGHR